MNFSASIQSVCDDSTSHTLIHPAVCSSSVQSPQKAPGWVFTRFSTSLPQPWWLLWGPGDDPPLENTIKYQVNNDDRCRIWCYVSVCVCPVCGQRWRLRTFQQVASGCWALSWRNGLCTSSAQPELQKNCFSFKSWLHWETFFFCFFLVVVESWSFTPAQKLKRRIWIRWNIEGLYCEGQCRSTVKANEFKRFHLIVRILSLLDAAWTVFGEVSCSSSTSSSTEDISGWTTLTFYWLPLYPSSFCSSSFNFTLSALFYHIQPFFPCLLMLKAHGSDSLTWTDVNPRGEREWLVSYKLHLVIRHLVTAGSTSKALGERGPPQSTLFLLILTPTCSVGYLRVLGYAHRPLIFGRSKVKLFLESRRSSTLNVSWSISSIPRKCH